MEITFVANSRVMGYRPGQIVKITEKDLTPMLKALLKNGKHLALIDPLDLDAPKPVKYVASPVQVEGDADGSTKSSSNSKERGPSSSENN